MKPFFFKPSKVLHTIYVYNIMEALQLEERFNIMQNDKERSAKAILRAITKCEHNSKYHHLK